MGYRLNVSRKTRLIAIICISATFFVAEIVVGFKTHSIAIIADAFHYINDILAFTVALGAIVVSERSDHPKWLTFGWQRAQLLGAFFNAVFLFTLGVSILLQSAERFAHIESVDQPLLVIIIGAIGLSLNLLSAVFAHEHHDHGSDGPATSGAPTAPHGHDLEKNGATTGAAVAPQTLAPSHVHNDSGARHGHGHQPSVQTHPSDGRAKHGQQGHDRQKHGHHEHDHGMMGVFLHVVGDAVNNVGVMVVGLIVMLATGSGRFYADPAVGMAIALMILASSIPLVIKTSKILLDSQPPGVDTEAIERDLCAVEGVMSVHELHARRLNQTKALASAHIIVQADGIDQFFAIVQSANETFHRHGIHSVSIQPERYAAPSPSDPAVRREEGPGSDSTSSVGSASSSSSTCKLSSCGPSCDDLSCCR